MEKQGVLGNDLLFTHKERVTATAVTERTVNNINIERVGAFVQAQQTR